MMRGLDAHRTYRRVPTPTTERMLLFLHGALGDRHTVNALRPSLEAHGIQHVHALDFEGHGERAARERPFRLEHFAENVVEWLDAHPDAEPMDVFGYSMGGYVALLVAASHPTRIRSVFTLGTKLHWSPEGAADAIRQLDPERIAAKVPAYAALLSARHSAVGWETVLRGTADALAALGAAPLLTPSVLAQVTCPVRLTLGDRDTTVPLDELREALGVLPRGSAEVFPDTPHPLERAPADRLARALAEFRASLGS
jgi:pimeloyl-ACP methyl ester carboxylesterase